MRQVVASTLTVIVLGMSLVPCAAAGRAGGARAQLPLRPEPAALGGAAYYVDDDAPGDPAPGDSSVGDPLEDGSPVHPYDNLQEGLDRCTLGDSVLIAKGSYTGTAILSSDGCKISGAGAGSTVLWGIALEVASQVESESYRFQLSDLSVDGGQIWISGAFIGGAYGPVANVILKNLELVSTDLGVGGFSSAIELLIENVRMRGGSLYLSATVGGALFAVIDHLDAPESLIIVDALTEAFASTEFKNVVAREINVGGSPTNCRIDFSISDSVISGGGLQLGACPDWGGLDASVRRTQFTGGSVGLTARGSEVRLDIEGSHFKDSSLSIDGRFGGNSYGFGHNLAVSASGNEFDASPIRIGIGHGGEGPAGAADVTLSNNILKGAPEGIRMEYWLDDASNVQESLISRIDVVNNTLVSNTTGIGIATALHEPGLDSLTTILKNNIITSGAVGIEIQGRDDHTLIVENNNVRTRPDGQYRGDLSDQTGLNGNISLPPWFKGPNDYRLESISPCIDRGGFGSEVPLFDFSGRPRPLDGNGDGYLAPDMGAYEFPGLPDGGRTRK